MREKVGTTVAKDLITMGVTLTPQRYRVWFMHRSAESPELDARIERRLAEGGAVTDVFLDRLAEEFLDRASDRDALAQNADALGRSSGVIADLSAKLAGTLAEFGASAGQSAAALEAPDLDRDAVAAIVRKSVEKTLGAIAATKAIEGDLTAAAQSVKATNASIVAAQKAAQTDQITGLCDRRQFHRRLTETIDAAQREGRSISVLAADIDRFDEVNEKWGRQVGDNIIKALSGKIVEHVRNGDLVARVGGDEFAIMLVDAEKTDAVRIAEKIHQAVSQSQFKKRKTGESIDAVTLSIGVATAGEKTAPEDLVDGAFDALNAAKQTGGDRVAAFGAETLALARSA